MSRTSVQQPRAGEVTRRGTIMRVIELAPEPADDRMAVTYATIEIRDHRGHLLEDTYAVMWWPRVHA